MELRLEGKEDGEEMSMSERREAITAKQRSELAWTEAKHTPIFTDSLGA